jgi:hypothetical protein
MGGIRMRRLLPIALVPLALLQPVKHQAVESEGAIPRFILHHDEWICVDRNPRQVDRQDCRALRKM